MKYLGFISLFLLICLTTTSVQASTVKWEIKFFNDTGIQIGDGEFDFDPDISSSVFLERPPGGPGFITEVEVNNLINSYDFRVLNRSWSPIRTPSTTWWGNSFESGGSQVFTRDGAYIGPFLLGESQDLQGGSVGNTFLRLGFDRETKTDLNATGTWRQNSGFLLNEDSGTWSAKALVPIPGTLLLLGSGLVSLTLAKRKKVLDISSRE